MIDKSNDRVSFSYGMKLQLPTKYESADFHVSFTSDVKDGESLLAAQMRVRNQVMLEIAEVYETLRASETGLLNEAPESKPASESRDTKDVSVSKPEEKPVPETRKKDTKALRQQIKFAFGVLEAKKLVSKADFVTKYLYGKKTDELNELEVTKTIVALRENFPKLGL